MTTAITKHAPAGLTTWGYMGDDLDAAGKLAKALCATGLAPNGMTPGQAFYVLLAGREMGLRGPVEALRHIQIVKGKPTVSAEMMRAFMLDGGCGLKWERQDDSGATLRVTRPDGSQGTFSFLEADARRAGLLGVSGSGWSKYPAAMYAARATSIAARLFCPDMVRGATYTPEELGAAVTVTEDGAVEATATEGNGTNPAPHDETELAAEVPGESPSTAEAGEVSGPDEVFPGVPRRDSERLSDEEVDRLVTLVCEQLGVDQGNGPISAMIAVEAELKKRRAPFSLSAMDKLTRGEARTVAEWVRAEAKKEVAA